MAENFKELLDASLEKVVMRPGALITGEVVEANEDYVVVAAGLKSDAEIPAEEFKTSEGELTVKVGDRVEVALEAVEDGTGNTVMSRERAVHDRAWGELAKVSENDEIIKGIITSKVKGGFTVEVNGLRGFLPGSLVDSWTQQEDAYADGSEMEFKIIKLDKARNNIVVSRRAIASENSEDQEKLLASLEEGMVVKGTVKNLTEYGAFVNLGGLDGLLHITDMAWKRIRHPTEILDVGKEVEARVLRVDREQARISLGIKQLTEDPWSNITNKYQVDARCVGKVTNVTDYGAFVELDEGVEGLVHLTEMDWTNKNIHPSKACKIGEQVEVVVLSVDEEQRRISLGMKQCKINPWQAFEEKYKIGDLIKGKVRSSTDFGMFVNVDGDIDGLIHVSDLSWDRPSAEIFQKYEKGDEIEVKLILIDAARERISLGLKQIEEDPFAIYVAANKKDSVVSGEVKKVSVRGALVKLNDRVDGYLRASEISRERVEDARTALNKGDQVEAKIVKIVANERRILLSIRSLEKERHEEAALEYSSNVSHESPKLGDKLKAHLFGKKKEDGDQ